MYNPASIVDLRRNPSFVVPSPIQTKTAPRSSRNTVVDGHRNEFTPAKIREFHTCSPNADFRGSAQTPNWTGQCDSCEELAGRLHIMEEHIISLESRQATFETQVLSLMKSISQDIQDLRSRSSRETSGIHYISRTSNQDVTRDAISSACVALERLIADAKNRTNTARLHS